MTDDNNVFFKNLEELNKAILNRLNLAVPELRKLCNSDQLRSDISKGLFLKNGVYISLKSYEHRMLYDGYESQFLINFVSFYSAMLNERNSIFKEFAIRTIAEMGLKDSQILFGPDLNDNEKNLFKTVLLLSDFGFLGFNNIEHKNNFRKLFDDQMNLLTSKQINRFEELYKSIIDKNYEEFKRQVSIIRGIVKNVRFDLYKRTKSPKIFRAENLEAFFSGFSLIVHGNLLVLNDIFSTKRPEYRNQLRISWTLLMTGTNTLIHLKSYLNKNNISFEVEDIIEQYKEISEDIRQYWQSIET